MAAPSDPPRKQPVPVILSSSAGGHADRALKGVMQHVLFGGAVTADDTRTNAGAHGRADGQQSGFAALWTEEAAAAAAAAEEEKEPAVVDDPLHPLPTYDDSVEPRDRVRWATHPDRPEAGAEEGSGEGGPARPKYEQVRVTGGWMKRPPRADDGASSAAAVAPAEALPAPAESKEEGPEGVSVPAPFVPLSADALRARVRARAEEMRPAVLLSAEEPTLNGRYKRRLLEAVANSALSSVAAKNKRKNALPWEAFAPNSAVSSNFGRR